jgi:hypothetical protein
VRLCSFEGCDRKRDARGLCASHYSQWKRNVPLFPIGSKYDDRPKCSFDGCEGKRSAKGLCHTHYRQQWRGEELSPITRPLGRTICAVSACAEPREPGKKQVLCATHFKVVNALAGARKRCIDPRRNSYANYGGRGIRFCLSCTYDGVAELCAAIGLPPDVDHSLDRIDVDGHYEIGNLRWADRQTQTANRRTPTTREWEAYCIENPAALEWLNVQRRT